MWPSGCRSVGARRVCFDYTGRSVERGRELVQVPAAATTSLAEYASARTIERLKAYSRCLVADLGEQLGEQCWLVSVLL